MNLKVRVKNPVFWVQIVLSILTPVLAYAGRRHGIYDGAAEGKKAAAHDRKRRLYLKRSARPGTA